MLDGQQWFIQSTDLHKGLCVCRWYGNSNPVGDLKVFVERKTHRESWKGEESVKERVVLRADRIVEFLDGEYTLEDAIEEQKVGMSASCLSQVANLCAVVLRADSIMAFLDGEYMLEDAIEEQGRWARQHPVHVK